MSDLNPTKKIEEIKKLPHFISWVGALPSSYEDCLSYNEQLRWFCSFLKEVVIPTVNTNAEAVQELQNLYVELKDYVDNYFESTDFEALVNARLQEMVTDGTFENLLETIVDSRIADFSEEFEETIEEIQEAMTNLQTTLEGEMQTLETNVNNSIQAIETEVESYSDSIEQNANDIIYINKTRNLEIPSEMKSIAHRGSSYEAPENTTASFKLAGRQGFWGCETDIYESADGVFYCMHDQTVNRTTDGTGYIWELTSAYIDSLTIIAGHRIADYPNLKVPRLEEYLKICKDYNMIPVIELKDNITHFQELYNILYKHNMHRKVMIQSFLVANLEGMLAIDNKLFTARLENTINDNSVNHAIEHGIQSYNVKYDALTSAEIDRLHSLGLKVGGWAIDVAGVNHNMRNFFLDYSILDSLDYFNTNEDEVLKYVNGLPLYSEKDLRYAKDGCFMGGILDGFIKRQGQAGTLHISEKYLPNTLIRVISTQIIPLREGSKINYVCDGQSRFSILAFDRHGESLADVGWIQEGIGAGNYTEERVGCSFGIATFSRVDNGNINDFDLKRFSTIIQKVDIVPNS